MNFRGLTRLFIPHIDGVPIAVREGYITRDLTMPDRDWTAYDAHPSRRGRANVAQLRIQRARKEREIPAFLRKQA